MIELRDVCKVYGDGTEALKDVTLSFKEGSVTVLKGVSGSGKSTILSLIAGLSKPTSGEIIVDKKKISKLPDHFAAEYRRENIGFVFQKYNLIPTLSAKENVLLPLFPKNLPREQMHTLALYAMEQFFIEHKAKNLVKNLSGGEQQRVAIARAVVNEPKIILADEPTANLDRRLAQDFIEQLKKLKSQNRTIIVATHDPLFFELDFVESIVTIENGKVIVCS